MKDLPAYLFLAYSVYWQIKISNFFGTRNSGFLCFILYCFLSIFISFLSYFIVFWFWGFVCSTPGEFDFIENTYQFGLFIMPFVNVMFYLGTEQSSNKHNPQNQEENKTIQSFNEKNHFIEIRNQIIHSEKSASENENTIAEPFDRKVYTEYSVKEQTAYSEKNTSERHLKENQSDKFKIYWSDFLNLIKNYPFFFTGLGLFILFLKFDLHLFYLSDYFLFFIFSGIIIPLYFIKQNFKQVLLKKTWEEVILLNAQSLLAVGLSLILTGMLWFLFDVFKMNKVSDDKSLSWFFSFWYEKIFLGWQLNYFLILAITSSLFIFLKFLKIQERKEIKQ